jgi:hypothetical protein
MALSPVLAQDINNGAHSASASNERIGGKEDEVRRMAAVGVFERGHRVAQIAARSYRNWPEMRTSPCD